jgi:hypothetical protein
MGKNEKGVFVFYRDGGDSRLRVVLSRLLHFIFSRSFMRRLPRGETEVLPFQVIDL